MKQDTGTYSTSLRLLEGHCIEAYCNPFTCSELPHGVGLYLHPFTGNAAPTLNVSQNGWTSGILPQNNSGGLYPWSPSDYSSTVRSIFSSFHYHYWMTIKELSYDFNNSDILRAGQWSPTSWMCNTYDVIAAQTCTSGKNPKAPDPWLVTPQKSEVDYRLSQSIAE